MYDVDLYKTAGLKIPYYARYSVGSKNGIDLKGQIKQSLRLIDEQDFIGRYQWYGLPDGINQQLLERIIYYRGQLMAFYVEELDKFFFLPYTLEIDQELPIDVYGRFRMVKPVPFDGTSNLESENGKRHDNALKNYLSIFIREPLYDVYQKDEEPELDKYCVLLKDYTEQENAGNITPKAYINDVYLDIMADCYPFARTNLLANSGIKGINVPSEDNVTDVENANKKIENAALTGQPYIAVVAGIQAQPLTDNSVMRTEEYLMYMQSVDNMRLSSLGLDSGGIFEKKAHTLESEQSMNMGIQSGVYQDGLLCRQRFCNIFNSIFDTSIWCDVPEQMAMMDMDMDGNLSETDDTSGKEMEDNTDESNF